jgi:hypothetical protein
MAEFLFPSGGHTFYHWLAYPKLEFVRGRGATFGPGYLALVHGDFSPKHSHQPRRFVLLDCGGLVR